MDGNAPKRSVKCLLPPGGGGTHLVGAWLVRLRSPNAESIRTSALARGAFFWGGCLVSSWGTRATPLTRRTPPLESLEVEGLANTEFQLHEASGTESPVIFCFRKRTKKNATLQAGKGEVPPSWLLGSVV